MFQPIVAGTGLVAWRNLQRSLPIQKELHANNAAQQRLTDHFSQNAVGLKDAESLISDRRIREVALTAFGLQDDLNSQVFIQRILEQGTSDPSALANRLADSRYRQMAEEFSFDGVTAIVGLTAAKTDRILSDFRDQSFELAVGETQPSLRLALNTERELESLAARDVSDDAKWFLVMGNPPLRQVFETALGLPSSFGRIDLEQQLGVFREKSLSTFGVSEISDIANDDVKDKLIDRFLLREQVATGLTSSSSSIALQLLQF